MKRILTLITVLATGCDGGGLLIVEHVDAGCEPSEAGTDASCDDAPDPDPE